MSKTFWQDLPKPFFCLAPMEDVTDSAFRRLIVKCGRPEVFFTEFTSTDGMISKGAPNVTHRLEFKDIEKPLIAQIWGNDPEKYVQAVKQIDEMGFDGIDLNMGCPAKKITKKGCCSGLIENHNLVKEIYLACSENSKLPISIKTRLGFNFLDTENWADFLLNLKPPAITIHGRIAKDMSKYPADWNEIKKFVDIKNDKKSDTIIIGNGDIKNKIDGLQKQREFKVDGLMIGRGIFDDLFIFNKDYPEKSINSLTILEKIELLEIHLNLFIERWPTQRYSVLKKFYKIYLSNFDSAQKFRIEMMESRSAIEAQNIINNWKNQLVD